MSDDRFCAGPAETETTFSQWCILELMGHRRLAGLVSEHVIAGQAFIRLDVFTPKSQDTLDGTDLPTVTQFYSPSAVYCITPTTEVIARKVAEQDSPRPVARFEIERGEGDGA